MPWIVNRNELLKLSSFVKAGNSDEDIQKEILSIAIQKSDAYLSSLNTQFSQNENLIPIDKYYEFLDSCFFFKKAHIHNKQFHILAAYAFLDLGVIDSKDYHRLINFFESPDNLRSSPDIFTEIQKPVFVTLAATGIGFAFGITMENIPAGVAIAGGTMLLNILTNYLTQDENCPDLTSEQFIVYCLLDKGIYSEYELASRIIDIYPNDISEILMELKEKGLICADDPSSSITKWKKVNKRKKRRKIA